MAYGAGLIADDGLNLTRHPNGVQVEAPKTAPQLIEARGFGLLPVSLAPPALLCLWVDLDQSPEDRLPKTQYREVFDTKIQICYGKGLPGLPAMILQYLKAQTGP
jgi:serine kinase of HPr protein (carbohydrate metabolism regulator)